jgi:hypothetical protein
MPLRIDGAADLDPRAKVWKWEEHLLVGPPCRRTEKSAQACTDERAQSWDREDNPAAVGVSASVHDSTAA